MSRLYNEHNPWMTMFDNELITITLYINEEQVPGKGEDSALRITGTPNAVLIATMDGCGGAGAQVYTKLGNASGARISAEHVGIALRKWFCEKQYGINGTAGKTSDQLAAEMKIWINSELQRQNSVIGSEESGVQSRLARKFPSTLAAVIAEVIEKNTIRCISFWAGDSRTFILRAVGLQQTSQDDIRGSGDPFDSLMNDGRLSNLVSLSKDYTIHTSEMIVSEPCVLLTASDGCFSYFQSPMELEWALLSTLVASSSPMQWESQLRSLLGSFASDDFTMNIAVLGFYNWTAVKNAYTPRWNTFRETYYEPLQKILDEQNLEAHYNLWLQYKKDYLIEDGV